MTSEFPEGTKIAPAMKRGGTRRLRAHAVLALGAGGLLLAVLGGRLAHPKHLR